jgi:hypothetical protein
LKGERKKEKKEREERKKSKKEREETKPTFSSLVSCFFNRYNITY